jgi:hypothetical protein
MKTTFAGGLVRLHGCGRSYTLAEWQMLSLRYYDVTETASGTVVAVEFRDCYCGSTICIDARPPKHDHEFTLVAQARQRYQGHDPESYEVLTKLIT